ncbi:MAG: hypothetical protein ATN35_00975 [Epulopiscium sp. Nele67-Bin004]|nr:MAG: hypothetical protein ATN35_00975 [Epulopiscium sp. Nele67-Bin004]
MALNLEQQKIVESPLSGHAVIRGIAGSGKTTVGVERVKLLAEQSPKGKILFVTYNKSLSNYIEQMINMTIPTAKSVVDIKNIDSISYGYFKAGHPELKTLWNDTPSFNEALQIAQSKYPNCRYLHQNYHKFLLDEIKWIKGCGYNTLEQYQDVERIGRMSGDGGYRLTRNSEAREAIYFLKDTIGEILSQKNSVDGIDTNILALQYMNNNNNKIFKYEHIIIDEAQDLTKVQFDIISRLSNNSKTCSVWLIMDVAQSIYPQAWLVKNRTYRSIGYDIGANRSYKLNKNYRTTTEISRCAYSLLHYDKELIKDDNFITPTLLSQHGSYPVYRGYNSYTDQQLAVIKLIKQLDYKLRDIAIVAKRKTSLEQLKNCLIGQNILCEMVAKEMKFNEDSIKLLTMHSIKGLEFKVVIIIDLNENIIPHKQDGLSYEELLEEEVGERKLFYVAMTRAKKELYMFSSGTPSKFISQIDNKFLCMNINSRIRALHSINPDNYYYKEEIADIHTKEEVVRQWIINELITNYDYPKEVVKIEYKINIGSKACKADVAVINQKTGEPHIIVETKNKDVDIMDAVRQLKSYMHASDCKYGVATNGRHIIFIDKDMNYISDIPKCDKTILTKGLEHYKYIDVKTFREHEFIKDTHTQEILNEDNVVEDELTKLRIYADIAAGIPIEILDDDKGTFKLPSKYIKTAENLYILQVKGDSMIDANIDDGDYVVVDSSQSVQNNEIGVVVYNGSATLKRVVQTGGLVLLLSANDDFEPISIIDGDFSVQGKLIGIIKQTQ